MQTSRFSTLVFIACAAATSALLEVAFEDDASFKIHIGSELWLQSAPIRAFSQGKWRSLKKTGVTHSTGSDRLGKYHCVNVSWEAQDDAMLLHTSLKTYDGQDLSLIHISEPT